MSEVFLITIAGAAVIAAMGYASVRADREQRLVKAQTIAELKLEIAALRLDNAQKDKRLKEARRPITDNEWGTCDNPELMEFDKLRREFANVILDKRIAKLEGGK